MRVAIAMLLVLALGARKTSAQGDQCTYADQYFASGSTSCQDGRQYRCVAGSWKPNGLECSDAAADADQPALRVDPSRAAPTVRQPGVRDPGVRQPQPPAVPAD
jgi:hypothetical protein